jgi:hypothetical protein
MVYGASTIERLRFAYGNNHMLDGIHDNDPVISRLLSRVRWIMGYREVYAGQFGAFGRLEDVLISCRGFKSTNF